MASTWGKISQLSSDVCIHIQKCTHTEGIEGELLIALNETTAYSSSNLEINSTQSHTNRQIFYHWTISQDLSLLWALRWDLLNLPDLALNSFWSPQKHWTCHFLASASQTGKYISYALKRTDPASREGGAVMHTVTGDLSRLHGYKAYSVRKHIIHSLFCVSQASLLHLRTCLTFNPTPHVLFIEIFFSLV